MGLRSFCATLRSAWRLPLDDLNYETSSEELGVLHYRRLAWWRRSGVLPWLAFPVKLVRSLVEHRPFPTRAYRGAKTLAVIGSLNQEHALRPILDELDGARVLALDRWRGAARFPEAWAYLASLVFLPKVVAASWRARGYRRLGYRFSPDVYWLACGYYIVARGLLEIMRPGLVLLSNDHSMRMRTLARAASDAGIETAYVQHASVTDGFPPLGFDLAFLDGRDAARKYDLPGSGGTLAFLTGIAKADGARREARGRSHIATVGVCVNALDPTDDVHRFVTRFAELAPDYRLILRPHPSDARAWGADTTLEISNPHTEAPFEFLDRVDAIVTGPSNIALEAALVEVLPIFFDFAGSARDHYGFVRNGLCATAESAEDAVAVLRDYGPHAPQFSRARDYCATIGTTHDGRSAELVASLLHEHLAGGIDMGRWKPVEGLDHLNASELIA
jgi:SAM-dependent methyltransferase